MRVIAGDYKGRKLQAPAGDEIRPTSDKVKGAVFNMIGARIEGAAFIDLFAGTGSMGIEALSRGATHCFFCDSSPQSMAVVKNNLSHVGAGNEAEFLRGDFRAALSRLSARMRPPSAQAAQTRVLFADPPYNAGYYDEIMQIVRAYDIINAGDLVILESDAKYAPGEYEGFEKIREKRYGRVGIDVYERTKA